MSETLSDFLKELRLADKLLPNRNPAIAWVWVFFPALLAYFVLMMRILNGKPIIGSTDVISKDFDKLLRSASPIEVIAKGNKAAEGPLWIDNDDGAPFLLYSDLKQNKIFRWEEGKGFFTVGKTLYLNNSGGCQSHVDGRGHGHRHSNSNGSGNTDRETSTCDSLHLSGSSGLIRAFPPSADNNLDLVICQHGERAVSLQRENGTKSVIASHYNGKRLNSPNDLAWSTEGHLYFTDQPPQVSSASAHKIGDGDGKAQQQQAADNFDTTRPDVISHGGLYMIHRSEIETAIDTGKPAEKPFLISAKMARPHGLVFSPGYSKLYVSNAEANDAYIQVFEVNANGLAHSGKLFVNITEVLSSTAKVKATGKTTTTAAATDTDNKGEAAVSLTPMSRASTSTSTAGGLKVDISGNLYASFPGGVLIFTPEAQLIGRLRTDRPVSSLAFSTDGHLYMAAQDLILRKRLGTKPPRPPEFKADKKK